MRRPGWAIVVLLAALALWTWHQRDGAGIADAPAASARAPAGAGGTARPGREARDEVAARPSQRDAAFLPPQALDTLALIESGGPFPYRQDGATFQNREHRLPARESGYYREYTVETPGSPDRGARRIIAGGDPPAEFFYTDDHYDSFRRFTDAGSDGSGGDDGDAAGGAR
ncbi:MAG: ribonuclease domain-containing protein [Luteimonas sp.]